MKKIMNNNHIKTSLFSGETLDSLEMTELMGGTVSTKDNNTAFKILCNLKNCPNTKCPFIGYCLIDDNIPIDDTNNSTN